MNELKPEDVMRAREALDRIQNFCEEIDYHLPPDEQTGYKMLPDWMIVFEFLNEAEALLREKDAEIERLKAKADKWLENLKAVLSERADHTEAVSEAITEFAEMLCEGRLDNDPVVIAVEVAVKEVKEDQNDD